MKRVLLLLQIQVAYSLFTLTLRGPPSLPSDASQILNPALASFSIETAFFEVFFGNISAPNNLSLNLLNHLKKRTGAAPEIRIGGITADSSYWNPKQNVALSNFIDSAGALRNTTIGPEFWKIPRLLFPEGSKIIMNLNLRDLSYPGALSMARATLEGLRPSQLAAFELGNEPDHYRHFTPQNYTAIWVTWAKNISSTLKIPPPIFQLAATADDPLWPYDSQAAKAQLGCSSALAAGVRGSGLAKTCSEHAYQFSVCDPRRSVTATLSNLVNHTRLAHDVIGTYRYLDLWQPRIHFVRQQLRDDAFVIGEFNSVSCSGKDGVSNTFGQALWLLDTVLYAATLNVSRVYYHQGGPLALQSSTQLNHGGLSFYNMWHPIANKNGPKQVFPSYAAYLFMAETLSGSKSLRIANLYPGKQPNGSTITTALGDKSSGQLVAYGIWDTSAPESYPAKIALLNLEIFNQTRTGPRTAAQFNISAFRRDRSALHIRRMRAPGADIKLGNLTTWAGQTFASGMPAGKLVEEVLNGDFVTIAASEAALISHPRYFVQAETSGTTQNHCPWSNPLPVLATVIWPASAWWIVA